MDGQCYGIIHINAIHVEFGYFNRSIKSCTIFYKTRNYWCLDYDKIEVPLYWRNPSGCYVLNSGDASELKEVSRYTDTYPIPHRYNLSKINTSKFEIPKVASDNIFNILPFTIGLEFETSAGNVPWHLLHKNALIPLYDGSITGHEYVTLPLQMSQVPIIKEYLDILTEYTTYDVSCSVHIHFGGFPIKIENIEHLCKCWSKFQNILLDYIPQYSYKVELYKPNGKAYNKPLNIRDFPSFCYRTTGNFIETVGDLYLTNKYDEDENRKWNVQGRYYNMNIMHLISGEDHKTVEFRFIRPTYHYEELKTYILVLGAFLKWVMYAGNQRLTMENVINFVYSKEDADLVFHNLKVFKHLTKTQINNNDKAGLNDSLKNYVFDLMPLK